MKEASHMIDEEQKCYISFPCQSLICNKTVNQFALLHGPEITPF